MEGQSCLEWTSEEVAEWIGSLGFPQYKECFISNNVTGRRLIWVESASSLPKLGITDWNHIKEITEKVRTLLKVQPPDWKRSITLPHRCKVGVFLERKSQSGIKADKLTLELA